MLKNKPESKKKIVFIEVCVNNKIKLVLIENGKINLGFIKN